MHGAEYGAYTHLEPTNEYLARDSRRVCWLDYFHAV